MEVGATISIKGLKGIIRYVGEYHEKPGIFVGVELEKPKGKNNGTIKGKKYFECPENHGLFVDLNTAKSIMKVVTENDETSDSTPLQSPRIDLKSTTKTKSISKSIDSIKSSNKPQTVTFALNNGNQPQTPAKGQTNSNQTDKLVKPVDTMQETHSAREPTVTFTKPNRPQNSPGSLTKPLAKPANADPLSRRHSTIPESKSNPGLTTNNKTDTIKTQSARSPTSTSDAKSDSENISTKPSPTSSKPTSTPEKATTPNANPSLKPGSLTKPLAKPANEDLLSRRHSTIPESKSNPGLTTNNKTNTIKTQSARSPTSTSDAKSDSENISTKPSSTSSKPTSTPEKATTPNANPSLKPGSLTKPLAKPANEDLLSRRHSTVPESKSNPGLTTNNKTDTIKTQSARSPTSASDAKIQSARPTSEQPARNQPQAPNSARDPPIKQIISTPQDSPIIPQASPNSQSQQPQQKQQSSNTNTTTNLIIPPLSIPQVQFEEPGLNKASAASVSFEEIKSNIPPTAASAMPSANRDYLIKRSSLPQPSTLPIATTSSAEQSDTENSPRIAKKPQVVITPEIKAKIKDLNAKHEGYIKQKALIRQKLLDIANSYKKKKVEQEKYLLKFANESQNKLAELQISLETDIIDLENQILESAERTHRYLEIADEQRANKVMELLKQINEEHVNFENDLDLFINAQRINVNTATQSVHILTERLKKVLMKRQINDKLISKKKSIITDRENELAEKRPRWQEVTGLRTTFSELSEKVNHFKKSSVYKNAEKEGMRRFYQMFTDVPLLDSLYSVLCIEKKTENNDIRHICELTKFVLSGYIANTSKCYDLFNALTEVNDTIEKGEIPHSLISVSLALDAISSVPLDNALTIFQLKSSAEKIKDEKLKNQLLDIIGEIKNSPLIHFALLNPNMKEEFIEFSKNLVFEMKKAEADEEDEECNLTQFKGQLEKFNVPEIDVIKGFIDFQMPQQSPQDKQKIPPEITKKKQEKKDIEAKSAFLQEEISKEKAKFEALRAELDEPMKLYMELADRLNEAKKKFDKFQIQNE